METKKRLIDANAYDAILKNREETLIEYSGSLSGAIKGCRELLAEEPTVDAVPVDEIKFLYCAIDKKGIPELKIQLGDRIFCLRRDNDPVDVVPVVRCKDCRWAREKDHREPTDTPKDSLICQCFMNHHIPAPWGARLAVKPEHFCSYGEKKQGEALRFPLVYAENKSTVSSFGSTPTVTTNWKPFSVRTITW